MNLKGESVLEIERVVCAFQRDKRVLDEVSFRVGREEVVALLGRNGAGKTTLMQIVMGMLKPQSGDVRVFGLSPFTKPVEVKRRIGYVGDRQTMPPRATLYELLALHRELFPTWDRELEQTLLDRFELRGNDQKLQTLSKGQVQRIALLLAVCHRPELLLLDEPAAGLDPVSRREFLETSIQLLNREGTTIVFSSHHMGDVERLGGRVLLLNDGKMQLDRSLDDLHEAHCVVSVPKADIGDSARLAALPGCVRVRAVRGDWHAVFRGTPAEVRVMVANALAIVPPSCSAVPLEELFIELVGDDGTAAAA